MDNIFVNLFRESYEKELDISRVRKDFHDQVVGREKVAFFNFICHTRSGKV